MAADPVPEVGTGGPRVANTAPTPGETLRRVAMMRAVVVGASAGLGRCIGVELARTGSKVALLARRADRLEAAVSECGDAAVAIPCDVTSDSSVGRAIDEAAATLGGIDALVYTPGISTLGRLADTPSETWRNVLDTNVVGATAVTAAALPHLQESAGRALYFSSLSSIGTPWPGLGVYAVSKAALEKLVDAWRAEHPEVAFTRVSIGDCAGGPGDGATGFIDQWDPDEATKTITTWLDRGLITGDMIDVDELVASVLDLLRAGPSISPASIVITSRSRR